METMGGFAFIIRSPTKLGGLLSGATQAQVLMKLNKSVTCRRNGNLCCSGCQMMEISYMITTKYVNHIAPKSGLVLLWNVQLQFLTFSLL